MPRRSKSEKDISSLESKKLRMTDMLINGTISKEAYAEKMVDFARKFYKLSERKMLLEDSICIQKDINRRMSELCDTLAKEQVLDEFDRLADVVDKTIIMDMDAAINLCSCESNVGDKKYLSLR